MAGVTIGIESSTTWASSEFLLAKIADIGGSYNETTDMHDVTSRSASTFATNTVGLSSATANISGRFPATAPLTGYAGNVTMAGKYGDINDNAVNLVGFSIDFNWPSIETTSKIAGESIFWRTFKPSVYTATGVVRVLVDETEPLISAVKAGDSVVAAVLDMDGTNTFAGNIHIHGIGMSMQVGQANTLEFPFTFIGAVTAVGSGNFFAAGAVPLVTPQTLVVSAASGRQYSGSAFPTRVGVNLNIGSPIEVSVDAQFTGVVTPG